MRFHTTWNATCSRDFNCRRLFFSFVNFFFLHRAMNALLAFIVLHVLIRPNVGCDERPRLEGNGFDLRYGRILDRRTGYHDDWIPVQELLF